MFMCFSLQLYFFFVFFFFNDTATTEIYTLSLHDALPISFSYGDGYALPEAHVRRATEIGLNALAATEHGNISSRSEEHTSELQSQSNLVCRLLLEKKKNKRYILIQQILHSPTILLIDE